jgi:Fe-S-cluster-containing dehydrogenase component
MKMRRRDFIKGLVTIPGISVLSMLADAQNSVSEGAKVSYAMVIDVDRCIGCGQCVIACKIENDVPTKIPVSRTWIEGYSVETGVPFSRTEVQKIVMNTVENPFLEAEWKYGEVFYVPKLCNQCSNAPCLNVCPVYARFHTEEGVVLVDKNTCIGCKYCITACPYGATYLHPEQKVTDKCTFCYHRVKRGLQPACVLACPTDARVFGDVNDKNSEVYRLLEENRVAVLKPEEGTFPRVFYINLDTSVVE